MATAYATVAAAVATAVATGVTAAATGDPDAYAGDDPAAVATGADAYAGDDPDGANSAYGSQTQNNGVNNTINVKYIKISAVGSVKSTSDYDITISEENEPQKYSTNISINRTEFKNTVDPTNDEIGIHNIVECLTNLQKLWAYIYTNLFIPLNI